MSMVPCPCSRYSIDTRERICPFCGILIAQLNGTLSTATMALGDNEGEDGIPRWGTARFHSRMNLVVRVRDTDQTVVFSNAQTEEISIGRADPVTGEKPLLDLVPFGGIEKGVSRRHASIVRIDNASLQLVDRGSPNGTYLNGQRLIPNQPRILRDGDEIRLGRLTLVIRFQRSTEEEISS